MVNEHPLLGTIGNMTFYYILQGNWKKEVPCISFTFQSKKYHYRPSSSTILVLVTAAHPWPFTNIMYTDSKTVSWLLFRNYYYYEFGREGEHFAVVTAVNRGKVLLSGLSQYHVNNCCKVLIHIATVLQIVAKPTNWSARYLNSSRRLKNWDYCLELESQFSLENWI